MRDRRQETFTRGFQFRWGGIMAWIESHQTLREHPKTYVLMDAIGIEKATALGHLQMFWWWCIDYALDGRMKPNAAQLARAADWKGDADTFANAMLVAGWLDHENEDWVVHDWHDYCGELVEKRLERKISKRRKVSEKRRTNPATIGTNPDKNPPTLPNRTQPNRTLPNPTQPKTRGLAAKIAAVTPQADFVERFQQTYEAKTGQPYRAIAKDYTLAAKLIQDYGMDTCVKKAVIFAGLCDSASAWFTSDGWSSYTIGKLSSHWNNITPEAKQPSPEEELQVEIKKQEVMRERADALVK